MKLRNRLGVAALAYTLIGIIWCNAQAQEWVNHKSNEEKAIWKQIQLVDVDISNSNDKLSNLNEKVKLVENHIFVKEELKNDLNALLKDVNENGEIQLSKPSNPDLIKNMDLLAVTKAIIQSETGYFKHGSGVTHNNGCGIMTWPEPGVRTYKRFDTKQQGFDACYSLIKRKYTEYTIEGMAAKWTGNDRVESWVKNVTYWYERYK